MTITLKWYTGCMEIIDSAILNMRPAQLSQIVKTATENAEEAKAQIAAVINEEIGNWHKDTVSGKKRITELKKLLDVVGGRKLSKAEKAIQRIIKNVDDCRPQYKGVFESAGKSCVTDGYRLVRYAAPLDCFDKVNPGFDVSRAIGDVSAYSMRLELPDVRELKADIKLAKMGKMDAGRVRYGGGMNGIMYDFGYGLPAVDAKYLVDMLEALPECAAFCKPGKTSAPVYFVSAEDDGILLPIRKHQEWEAAPIEQAAPVVEEAPIETPVESAPAPVESAPVEIESVETPAEDPAPEVEHVAENQQDAPDMKLNQIESALENRQVYGYKRDGNTVTAHRWKVFHITGNLYSQEPQADSYGQRYAHVVLFFPGVKIGLDIGMLSSWQLDQYTIEDVTSRFPVSTVDALNELMAGRMESDEHIRDSYIAFVRQYDLAFAQKLEAYKAGYIRRMEQKQQEAHEERARREEQERLDRERAIADELAKAEQTIINGGYVENKMIDGKSLFLRLFDKHGIDLPIRSRGWAINKLRGFEQHNDGMITIRYSQTRKNEKISDRCFAAYCKLRELLKAKEADKQQQEEQEASAAVDMPALDRVLAVAVAVNDGAHDGAAIADYLNLYCNDMITEDEAKSALLRYTAPLALPAHEEAAQATEMPAAVSSVVAVSPVFLGACARLYAHGADSGFSGGVPGFDNVRTSPTFCKVSLHNTS